MQIDITDQTDTVTSKQLNTLKDVMQFVAKQEGIIESAELSISIVTNDVIKQLNQEYRNRDEATDVLSFPLENPFQANEVTMPIMIGDIIISIEKVKEQAKQYNHSFERELFFLATHGLLHVLGYTHDNKENAQKMFDKQEVILKEFHLERT